MTPEKIAIAATIASPVLTILTWLVTRERFAEFWKKRFKQILIIAVVLSGITLLWRMGWLAWLQNQITWPVWVLLLYSAIVFCLPIGIFFSLPHILDIIDNLKERKKESAIEYYTIYGARWYRSSYGFRRPPVCAKCLMEMRNLSMPERIDPYPVEAWECRKCGHKIRWDCRRQGDLLEDVAAHYNAAIRRTLEQNPWSVESKP
jgi:hypothetical protein